MSGLHGLVRHLLARNTAPELDPAAVERHERAFYRRYVQPGMTVFDVGANIGELTLLFRNAVGRSGSVHAFEANAETYSTLAAAVKNAACANVAVNCVAVTDMVGRVPLYVYAPEYASWTTLARRPLSRYGIEIDPPRVEETDTVTVDHYCNTRGIREIDLLKVDVEGAEYQVLRGAEQMLRLQAVRCCVFEFGQTTFDMGNRPADIERYLADCGYDVTNLVGGMPIFPGGSSAATARFAMHVCRPRTGGGRRSASER